MAEVFAPDSVAALCHICTMYIMVTNGRGVARNGRPLLVTQSGDVNLKLTTDIR